MTAAALATTLVAAAGVFAGTRLLIPWLTRRVLDVPVHRSSHDVPTPRGGGLAVVGVVLMATTLIAVARSDEPRGTAVIIIGSLALAVVSWIDDLTGLHQVPRLIVQVAAVTAGVIAAGGDAHFVAAGLPLVLDRLLAALLWLWFVNLFNFMDGIDGITGVESAIAGAGVAVVALTAPAAAGLDAVGLVGLGVAGAAVGFLWWNWHPASVFLGDVGSVTLGYVIGWLLLELAAAGYWAPALLLPAYYLADATFTLGHRLIAGQPVWVAHRDHFYQRATRTLSHAGITLRVLAAGVALLGLAVLAAHWNEWIPLAAGAVVTYWLLRHLGEAASH